MGLVKYDDDLSKCDLPRQRALQGSQGVKLASTAESDESGKSLKSVTLIGGSCSSLGRDFKPDPLTIRTLTSIYREV